MTLFFELLGVAVLILLNAFFVAAEYGLVTARRTRIIELQHQGNRRARDVLRITGDPGRFIAAMQLGVTLTSLGIGALGEATLSREFDKWMSTVLAIAIAYAILSFFHVVFGELVPKGAALGHAEGTALWVSTPVRAFIAVFRPAIWLLQEATDAILHSFGLEPPGAEREVHSEAELRMLVSRSTQQGAIQEGERELIEKVFVFGDKDVADVMVREAGRGRGLDRHAARGGARRRARLAVHALPRLSRVARRHRRRPPRARPVQRDPRPRAHRPRAGVAAAAGVRRPRDEGPRRRCCRSFGARTATSPW